MVGQAAEHVTQARFLGPHGVFYRAGRSGMGDVSWSIRRARNLKFERLGPHPEGDPVCVCAASAVIALVVHFQSTGRPNRRHWM